jgi:hypothetical protein
LWQQTNELILKIIRKIGRMFQQLQQRKSQRRKEKKKDIMCTQCIVESQKEQGEDICASHSSFATKG